MYKQGVTSEVMEQAEQFVLSDKNFLPSRTIGLPEDIAKAIAFLADRSMEFNAISQFLMCYHFILNEKLITFESVLSCSILIWSIIDEN